MKVFTRGLRLGFTYLSERLPLVVDGLGKGKRFHAHAKQPFMISHTKLSLQYSGKCDHPAVMCYEKIEEYVHGNL